jgi:hypothetical protein
VNTFNAPARSAHFRRRFLGVPLVQALAVRGDPHWFLDLLQLWRPAGEPSGAHGLRLAVRDGYLNFYRRGQSVARVSVVGGELRGEAHVKYFSPAAREAGVQAYGRFTGARVRSVVYDEPYDGVATLMTWTAVIDANYAGLEKQLVDALTAENDNVVDLEMGLPAWGAKTAAPRMDLVTIENGEVVFWEAKTSDDARIRSRLFEPTLKPEVLRQLEDYRLFLAQPGHAQQVGKAYRDAAALIVSLRKIADQVGITRPIGPQIMAAANASTLNVERQAMLVILDDQPPEGPRWRSWFANGHADRLAGHAKVLALQTPGRLKRDSAR